MDVHSTGTDGYSSKDGTCSRSVRGDPLRSEREIRMNAEWKGDKMENRRRNTISKSIVFYA